MKKILSLFMITLLLITSFVACGEKPAETALNSQAEQVSQSEVTLETEKAPVLEKTFDGTTLSVMLAYGGADKSFDKFTEETGIKIEYIEISTGKALAKLQAEEGQTTADVWFGGGVDSYISATDLGYLEQYPSPESDKINPAYKDAEGYWTGLALVPAGFLVNNSVLEEKGLEAPKTWSDLADPKYKNEIIMASPAISGTQYAIVNGLLQAFGEEDGWDLFTKINENVDIYAKGGGEPGPKVCAGEYGIAVLALTGGTYALEAEYPVSVIAPQDFVPWTPAPIAIFANSQKKDAAKVFVDYMLSEKGQLALSEADARIMSREGIPVPEVMKNIDVTKLIQQDVLLFGSQRENILDKWASMAGSKDQ